MIEKANCVQIGSLVKSHGVNGEVAIALEANFSAESVRPDFLFIDVDGGLVPFAVTSIRTRSENSVLVKFELLSNEKEVLKYKDCKVWMDRDAVLEDHETTVNELVGYKVFDAEAGYIGILEEIGGTDANPLFVIKGVGGEILIPVADEFIEAIDDDKQELHLDTPTGLIDLNE